MGYAEEALVSDMANSAARVGDLDWLSCGKP
jgi:hypothetical protein